MAAKTKSGSSSSTLKKCTTGSSSHPLAPLQGSRAHRIHPSLTNKHGIVFVDEVQCEKYDGLVTKKISAPKYINVKLLQALGMWDDMNARVGHLCFMIMCNHSFNIMRN